MRWLLVATLAIGAAASAQPRKPGPRHHGKGPPPNFSALDRLNRMPPRQRERMLDRLPPERRHEVERRLREFNDLPPGEREALRQRFESFQRLPPERQDEARRVFRRFSELPEDRRRAIQDEIDSINRMTPEERSKRAGSAEFREKFSPQERRLMREMWETFRPPPPPPSNSPPVIEP